MAPAHQLIAGIEVLLISIGRDMGSCAVIAVSSPVPAAVCVVQIVLHGPTDPTTAGSFANCPAVRLSAERVHRSAQDVRRSGFLTNDCLDWEDEVNCLKCITHPRLLNQSEDDIYPSPGACVSQTVS